MVHSRARLGKSAARDIVCREGNAMERDGPVVRLREDGAQVTVAVLSPRIVRVTLETGGPRTAPSYVVDRQWAPAPFEIVDGAPPRITTDALQVELATGPLRLGFLDPRGEWLLREPADGGMSSEAEPGGRRRLRSALTFSGEQHFYGLGQGGGDLDRLGVSRQLWNSHLGRGPGSDLGVPLLVSSRGYALFWDNPGEAVLTVGRS